jgi:hypothetical protein
VVRKIAKEKEVSIEGKRLYEELLEDEKLLGLTDFK